MKSLLLLSLLLLPLAACVPDVPQKPPPGPTVVVLLDLAATPPQVPAPNDLATLMTGKISVPDLPTDTLAQREFNKNYLGTLPAFPYETPVQVHLSGALAPSSVIAQNVVVLDITAQMPVTGLKPVFDASNTAIDMAPPTGGWQRAHQYAVGLVAGPHRLIGANNEPVIGSPTWELVSSRNPLVHCPNDDLTSSFCTLAVDIIPSTKTDPTARYNEQLGNALQLEVIRRGYAQPLPTTGLSLLDTVRSLANLSAQDSIPSMWTFTILDAGEVTFDPANQIVPFPNDLLLSAAGLVSLPLPGTTSPPSPDKCANASDPITQLYCGLDTLDGFSTIAPLVSASGASGATAPVVNATIDAASLNTQSVGLIALGTKAPAGEQTSPSYAPCLNCIGTVTAPPQVLQWALNAPLDEKTTYLAYVTSSVKDDQGKNLVANPIFALLRLTNSLVGGADGKTSQVNILTDAQAQQLEPLRAGYKPALDALEAAGVPRAQVVLAWTFTTQSEGTLLDQLYQYVGSPALQSLPLGVVFLAADQTGAYANAAMAAGISIDSIGGFFFGIFNTPVAVTGSGGTLDLAHPRAEPVFFTLAVPKTTTVTQPVAGYPITIFGHGLTRDRNDFLALANAVAGAGQMTLAADVVFHGDRSSCTGSAAYLSQLPQFSGMTVTDSTACANPATMKCNEDPFIGRCVALIDSTRKACPGLNIPGGGPDPTGNLGCLAQHRGLCEADLKCEEGDFLRDVTGRPLISGWNMFSLTNFFATRDNFRQQVIDLAQLVHLLKPAIPALVATHGGAQYRFDPSKINYVGMSLGGILGTLFNAASPDTNNVVLNVPGGDLTQIILNAPAFASQKNQLELGLSLQGIRVGSPAFDQFIDIAQWVLDPADPANMGWRLTHPVTLASGAQVPNTNRKAFIQFIQGDEVVPNVSNFALVAAAERHANLMMPPNLNCGGANPTTLFCYEFTETDPNLMFDATSVPTAQRHGFLLAPPTAPMQSPSMQATLLTLTAQTQVATFLKTGNYK